MSVPHAVHLYRTHQFADSVPAPSPSAQSPTLIAFHFLLRSNNSPSRTTAQLFPGRESASRTKRLTPSLSSMAVVVIAKTPPLGQRRACSARPAAPPSAPRVSACGCGASLPSPPTPSADLSQPRRGSSAGAAALKPPGRPARPAHCVRVRCSLAPYASHLARWPYPALLADAATPRQGSLAGPQGRQACYPGTKQDRVRPIAPGPHSIVPHRSR